MSLAAVATLAPAGPAFAADTPAAAPPAPCRVLVGGGGKGPALPGTDNDFWNRINFAFYDGAQYALSETGRAMENLFYVIGSPQAARAEGDVLAKAAAARCSEVVRVSAYGDDTASPFELVFRITATPVALTGGGAGASGASLGKPVYQHEYRYPVNPDVEREVRPGELGAKAVAAYLEAVGAK